MCDMHHLGMAVPVQTKNSLGEPCFKCSLCGFEETPQEIGQRMAKKVAKKLKLNLSLA